MQLRFRLSFTVLLGCLMLLVGAISAHSGSIKPGTFYVVGVGPAGPEHTTLRALEVIKGVDYILCEDKMVERFKPYVKDKPVLADPWKGMWDYKGKPWEELPKMKLEEKRAFQEERIRIREEIVRQIKEKLAQGKTVALLDSGDPCLFGPSHWFSEGFEPQQVEIIPGVGAFTAAMAALKKSSIPAYDTRFVMQTSPYFFTGSGKEMLGELAKYPISMVFYMGIRELPNLVPLLRQSHPGDLPIAVVYNAGYPDKEKVVKGTLDTILEQVAGEKEKWMGLIIVGRCLEGKPYRTRVENLVGYQDVKKSKQSDSTVPKP
ncbi:SAM-dependent methyltransferase [Desulfobacca acetoxidans]|uniref:Uroporphyrin-III C/tetrapyrrole (Corrin/Porphyrin) methyltransferase n=1 Tax=Desulfobacca acetoxidans (strain ATCC 700848 / DSM 11109 / ASRB2) TaxID=880072 RepID=F2NHX1_DESAR|nr:SAM-dependent methyltransferase [Desulfobacca acetoxidans]AEB09456.1 Uroporphyrin-III C/tetrapyrrole (Corrin/Porphyrin) methyltransferase [Desulfobacca acetoxidans DSM 11109]